MELWQRKSLVDFMEQLLEQWDEESGDHEPVHESLAQEMAAAAATVYDSGQSAIKFAREYK